jgi:hypothetical protein
MPYKILPYTKRRAKQLGVTVTPSTKPKKYKIDVKPKTHTPSSTTTKSSIIRCGAPQYADYPTYMNLEKKGLVPKGYAKTRRRLYKQRHEKDRHVKGTRGWYADQLLW